MRLTVNATVIALKKALLPMLILLAALLLVGMVIFSALSISPAAFEPIEIAVISEDNSPLAVSLIESTVNSRFKSLAQIRLCENEKQTVGCAAVITLPNGFWQSVMSGENLSPKLEIRSASPFEGLWVRQLADSAARLLTRAQNAVSGIYAAALKDGLSDSEIDRVIFAADMSLLNDYLTRKGRFESVYLSATGSIGISEYYLCSAASFAVFSLLFLMYEPLSVTKSFSRFSGCKWRCFFAAAAAAFILSLLLTSLAAATVKPDIRVILSREILLSAFLCCSLLLFSLAFMPDMPCCAAFCFCSAVVQALFGGGFLPEALLPQKLSLLCGLLPLSLLRRLFSNAAFSANFGCEAAAIFWCALLTAAAAAKWLRTGAK